MSTGTNKERIEQNNILLEDIKTQIQNLPEAGGSGDVKLFETEEEMQADKTAKEGDLAVVYRSEVKNATVDSKFQVATFPDTVVLDTAITDYVEVRYRAVDSSKMFDCMGQLDSSNFMMDCRTETGEVRIQYESSDGITYTRTDTTGNPVDFGTEIYYEMTEMWNDAIGKFIRIGGSTFDGLFQYGPIDGGYLLSNKSNKILVPTNKIQSPSDANYESICSDVSTTIIKVTEKDELGRMLSGIKYGPLGGCYVVDGTLYGIQYSTRTYYWTMPFTVDWVNKTIIGTENHTTVYLENDTYGSLNITSDDEYIFGGIQYSDANKSSTVQENSSLLEHIMYDIAPTQLNAISEYVYGKEFYGKNGVETGTLTQDISNSFDDTNAEVYSKIQNQYNNLEPRVLTDDAKTIDKNIYCIPAKSDGTPLLDTSSVTNMGSMFASCTNLTEIPLLNTSNVTKMGGMFYECTNLATIPLLDTSKVTNMVNMFCLCKNITTIPQLNTSSVTNMNNMFRSCTKLTEIPLLDTNSVTSMSGMFYKCTNLATIPLLDTSKVTNMEGMFNSCTNLTTIPLLDTSKVTNMDNMFAVCPSLSDESLNNILAMCTNATSYTSTKRLNYIGLTPTQATKCTTLSNYSAFTAAGWTTGY